jgi:hypothetical protein
MNEYYNFDSQISYAVFSRKLQDAISEWPIHVELTAMANSELIYSLEGNYDTSAGPHTSAIIVSSNLSFPYVPSSKPNLNESHILNFRVFFIASMPE